MRQHHTSRICHTELRWTGFYCSIGALNDMRRWILVSVANYASTTAAPITTTTATIPTTCFTTDINHGSHLSQYISPLKGVGWDEGCGVVCVFVWGG
jgi:hypothetical protein